MSRYDTVVIGAGLAGLVTARDLRGHNVDAVVLEARDRVGGRTWSREFAAVGDRIDLGAEWVAPAVHTALTGELLRYGLNLMPNDLPYAAAEDKAAGMPQPEFRAKLRNVMSHCDNDAARVEFDSSDWYHAVHDLDVPMSEYATGLTDDVKVREYFLANAFALMGGDEHEYSAINLLHEIAGFGSTEAAFGGETARISGGADCLSITIARALGSCVRLAWPVSGVRVAGDAVEVVGPRGRIEARSVVVAAPVNVLSGIDLDMPLPASARSVIGSGHAGLAAKGWASVQGLPAAVQSMGWPDAVEVYTVAGERGAALATFSLASPSHDEALARAWAAVKARHPRTEFSGEYSSHDWTQDPYARGTWVAARPGQAHGLRELADLPGPCFFAGGDVSRRWFGWMDGAITSGADAATRVTAYLNGGPVPSARG